MELVLALKKSLALLADRPDEPPTPRDAMYVQGREGPQLCSLVNLTSKSVCVSTTIEQLGGELLLGQCAVRSCVVLLLFWSCVSACLTLPMPTPCAFCSL